ncbi:hypothetical protein [Stenotrophomonas maltophilia]|uniref:hypothetical protein n=1 Tax=Stenotrophomonas maltophilia TaxID=40324 RepID=UPI000C26520B|nr:hypothetical protein [Stenotrophomonas maltophilia]PJL44704.1 hypothetical protein B9Y56_08445 [Stenotrophomonas maltophilia]
MSALVLVPAPDVPGIPARMRQPTKDAYRQWLTQANERIEQLQAEVAELRAGGSTSTTRPGLVADLVTAATALGHHETLRSSSDETIDYWRTRVEQLRTELIGDSNG